MAYDEVLAGRIREVLGGTAGVTERKMFGGLAFLVDGRMCCGVTGQDLMVRVGKHEHEAALQRPYARVMDFTGRPLRGFVYVATGGIKSAADLERWVERGKLAAGAAAEARPARRK